MKIYVWEGDGISNSYGNDGVLVVLAETPDQAREMVRARATEHATAMAAYREEVARVRAQLGRTNIAKSPEWAAVFERYPRADNVFDGRDDALDREPDQVIDLDVPTIVAYNTGNEG